MGIIIIKNFNVINNIPSQALAVPAVAISTQTYDGS